MTGFAAPLRTRSLLLVPASAAHVRAELEGRDRLGALLGATVPPSWPPGEYDRAAQEYFLGCLTTAGSAGVGWYGWYAVRRHDREHEATVVGGGGYFGPPGADGAVEIGYSVCPEWRGRGYAAEMAGALAAHAAAQPGVARVIAHTSATNPASIAVLERVGFAMAGPGAEAGTLRFEWSPPRAGARA
jgi:RimJ/RimL family protein N-acetyltransferase